MPLAPRIAYSLALVVGIVSADATVLMAQAAPAGDLPKAADGRALNLDFETGTLADWTAAGNAFKQQPIEGDTVFPRRGNMHSRHQGKFWIGGYERVKDLPTGTLTSAPFKATHPWCGFLIAGGPHRETRVELVRHDNGAIIWSGSGHTTEDLEPVAVDLTAHQSQEIFIRIVDEHTGHWGHINFDDFRFYAAKPNFPPRKVASPPAADAGTAKPAAPIDQFKFNGLPPAEAAAAMTVPEGFKVTLLAGEPVVQQPIAMAFDDRGRLWVAEAYSYPIKVKPEEARDRILIFADSDGDGTFDTRKIFAEKLNLVSGLELGFGGVYVGAAPELLFIPDADGDDVPDGPPQVLLDGWGYQDTHETLNAFIWGPDGWLYGCHGVFTHSRVGKPGTPDDKRVPINAGIWRYHPVRHEFEVFAHGTSNPWGVDFNDRGQCFLTACVIPHLYHVIQNGRYERQAGSHFNPYTYDDIKTIALHRHWIGGSPHAGNNRSDSAGGGHAHSGAMIYLGGKWPAKYRDQIFMNNIHGARINQDSLTPKDSGYIGDRAPDFLLANDAWSQLLYFTYGPDGDVYMIDWYDRQQCHHRDIAIHDRGNGRIFKISYEGRAGSVGARSGGPTKTPVDLKKLTDLELVELQLHANDWYVRHARRILQERTAKGTIDAKARERLAEIARTHADDTRRLRALWALHVSGGIDVNLLIDKISDASPYVRGWCVQLAFEHRVPMQPLWQMGELEAQDPSPIVRLYIASALPRLAMGERTVLLVSLLQHAEDAGDHNLPLMYWYALESVVEAAPLDAAHMPAYVKIDSVRAFLIRRLAQLGTPEVLDATIKQIPADAAGRQLFLRELLTGLEGRRQVPMPKSWPAMFATLAKSDDAALRDAAESLSLTFGDQSVVTKLQQTLLDAMANPERRRAALTALVKARVDGMVPKLHGLLNDAEMRGPVLRSLAAYDDSGTPVAVLAVFQSFSPAEKRDAISTLCARLPYAQALLDAVEDKTVASTDLTADLVRQLRNFKNPALDQRIKDVWGTLNDTPEERLKQIAQYKQMLTAPTPKRPDLMLGRAVFVKTCAQCHTLFGTGGKIGPELTGANRANLDYVLSNVIDPSALIGKDYVAHVIETSDGRVLTGLVRNETPTALTIVTATETIVVPKGEIDSRAPSAKSMMADDVLKTLSDDQVRGLVAYLAAPGQVPTLATADNAKSLFNGRDLTGWTGNAELWSVENGEIVGRTSGLAKNEFLVSDLAADDFRLTLEVKLVENKGNSGIQFRSEAQPGGAVKGYQADAGVGWWGKLYEEHGRALLWPESGEQFLKPGEWNRYEIIAVGSRVQTKLNGHKCVDLADPAGAKRGIFALQLHSGGPTEVRYRNLELEVGPKWEFRVGQ